MCGDHGDFGRAYVEHVCSVYVLLIYLYIDEFVYLPLCKSVYIYVHKM